MGHQGAPIDIFLNCTLKNSELAINWPSSGPRLHIYAICNIGVWLVYGQILTKL